MKLRSKYQEDQDMEKITRLLRALGEITRSNLPPRIKLLAGKSIIRLLGQG